MPDEIKPHVLAAVRLDKARTCLRDAEANLSANLFFVAANRSYYCVYNAMRTVLALENFDSKKHSGVISEFNKNYVKTEIFPKTLSKIISGTFDVRRDSDYNDHYIISKSKVAEQVKNAKIFLTAVEEYLSRAAPEALTASVDK